MKGCLVINSKYNQAMVPLYIGQYFLIAPPNAQIVYGTIPQNTIYWTDINEMALATNNFVSSPVIPDPDRATDADPRPPTRGFIP